MKKYTRLFILILIIVSCGRLTNSPYEVHVDRLNLNQKNLSVILESSREIKGPEDYTIAVISDTHDYYDGLDKQVSFINSRYEDIDFVIVTGDMSNVGLVSEFQETKKRLDRLRIPYITTSGNHDLLIDGESVYSRLFGNDTYAFDYKGTKFILFNNNNWESSKGVPDTTWVEKQLQETEESQLKLLFSHVAPNDEDRFNTDQIFKWENLMMDYGVEYYVNGHNHNPGTSVFGGAIHVTAGSSSKEVILLMHISPNGASHEFIGL